MVLGCISGGGVGDLVRTDGNINPEHYHQIFIHQVTPSGKHLVGNDLKKKHTWVEKTHNKHYQS